MAIVGMGTDLVEIERIEQALARNGSRFAARLLTESERQVMATIAHPHFYLAKRFAAKEAAAKALGTGIAEGVSFQDFEISNRESGQPQLHLRGRAAEIAASLGVCRNWLSLTDEKRYAMATVILESD